MLNRWERPKCLYPKCEPPEGWDVIWAILEASNAEHAERAEQRGYQRGYKAGRKAQENADAE